MKNKMKLGIFFVMMFWISSVKWVYADSSWMWLSKEKPYELLPIAIVFTILIEVIMVWRLLQIENLKKVVFIVIAGNMLSFFIPYITNYALLREEMGYKSIERAFSTGPYYIVGLGYLFLTIAIELPFIYAALKEEIKGKKKGVLVICIANVITTFFVFILERIKCYGQW